MIPVPSVPIRIGFLLLVLVVIIHDLVVGVVILTVLRAAGLLTAHVGTAMDDAVHHLGEHLGLVIRPTDKTDKTAHILSPLLLLGIKSNQ